MLQFPLLTRVGSFFGRSTRVPGRDPRRSATRFRIGVESLEGRALLATVSVHVLNFSFNPTPVTIHVGDTVHWVWDTNNHSTTSVAGIAESWDSGVHNTGFTFDHTFTHAGSFPYYCTIHGMDNGNGTASGMSGTITVMSTSSATLQSIALTPASPTIGIGATQQFTATGTFSDSSTQNISSQVTWASATPSVATITSTGLATGVAAGTSSINASLNGVTGSTTLTVSESTSKIVPTLVSEMRMTAGKGSHRKIVGFTLVFSTALDSGVAQDVTHYKVVQPGATKRSHPVAVKVGMAMYNPSNDAVTLMLGKFNAKKPLTLTATGLLGSTGAPASTIVTRL